MSSSKRLIQLVDSAYKNQDIPAIRQAYYEYYNNNCLHPIKQDIYDAHSSTKRTIFINCGQCYHCMHTKINEWCTRMYAHAEDFKHVYFVTLTYRSFTDDINPVNVLMLDKLKQAIWHKDAFNSTKRFSFSPCLLVKKHYQDFMKRLRKYSGFNDITFVLSGEYGHDYGRPHFHMILFTNGELTKLHIQRAWSVALWRSNSNKWSYKTSQKNNGFAYYFPIGRVDFNDLVANGTFNTSAKIKVDGTFMNAANCFAYVCKYVCKSDKPNLNRLKLAYDCLFVRQKFVKLFNDEVQYNFAADYLRRAGYFNLEMQNKVLNNSNLVSYEKTLFQPHGCIYAKDLQNECSKIIGVSRCVVPFFSSTYYEFKHSFAPFCEFSRGTPIGSVYAKRNIFEFAKGVFTKPLLQDQSFVVPFYFRTKAREHLYGLRCCKPSRCGRSFVLGSLPNLLGRFQNASLSNGSPLRECFSRTRSHVSTRLALTHPSYVFKDASTGERVILRDGMARHFLFNRHTRKYDNTRNVPLSDFIRYWCNSIQDEIVRGKNAALCSQEHLRFIDAASCVVTDVGISLNHIKDSFIRNQELYLKDRQNFYHSIHASAE